MRTPAGRNGTVILMNLALLVVTCQAPTTQSETQATASNSSSATLLFKSTFGKGVALAQPGDCGSLGCYQPVTGTDQSTGYSWPPNIWGSTGTWNKGGYAQLIADAGRSMTSSTVGNYVLNELQTVTGPDGNPTTAIYGENRGSDRKGKTSRQNPYVITPDVNQPQSDIYIREWIKLQPNLASQLKPGQFSDGSWGDWRAFAEWKTGGQAMGGKSGCVPGGPAWGGDYRNIVYVMMDSRKNLYWRMQGDNVANGGLPYKVYWKVDNHEVPVPVGKWFQFEWFWHRSSGPDGRAWAAVNGRVIGEFQGPVMGEYGCKINRIVPFTVYTGGHFPAYQWVTGLEIWNGFPQDATAH